MEQEHFIYRDEFKDKMTLDPIGKYAKYNKFPYKLLIHLALIILTCLSIEYTHSSFTPFSRQQDQEWLSMFYNDEQVSQGNGIYIFYQLSDFQTHLTGLFGNIVAFNAAYFQQINIDTLEIYFQYVPAVVDTPNAMENFQRIQIDPTQGIVDPFDQTSTASIKKFLAQTSSFVIEIPNLQVTLAQHSMPYSCWSFQIEYKFLLNTFLVSVLSSNGKVCNEYLQERFTSVIFEGSQTFLQIAIIIFAVASSILSFKYLFDMIRDYMKCKQKGQILFPVVNEMQRGKNKESNENEEGEKEEGDNLLLVLSEKRPWHALTFEEKCQYFDLWFIVVLAGNFCQIYSSFFILLQNNHEDNVSILSQSFMWAQGFGCAFAWLSSLKYLNFAAEYNMTTDVVHKSFPKIGKHFMGFVPILMAYVIVGLSSFGASQRFATFRDTFATLFSLLLGDSIHDITLDLEENGVSPVLAILYITSFIVIFILSVNNVMVAIIQDEAEMRRAKMEESEALKLLNYKKKKLQLKIQQLNKSSGFNDSITNLPQVVPTSQQQKPLEANENNFSINDNESGNPFSDESVPEQRFRRSSSLNNIVTMTIETEMVTQSPVEATIKPVRPTARGGIKRVNTMWVEGESAENVSPVKKQGVAWKDKNDISEENEDLSEEIPQSQESSEEQQRKLKSEASKETFNKMFASQRQEISMMAMSRVARQLTKRATIARSTDNDTEQLLPSVDVAEQISREVELLTEQKRVQRNIYVKFIHGFNEITKILDQQVYELRDNLYLYRLSKEQQALIRTRFLDTLRYFQKLTSLPPVEPAQ